MRRGACLVAGVALAVAVAAPALGAAWLSKTTARRTAVTLTSQACRSIDWCVDYEVVPARRCSRAGNGTVYCRIAFVTARDRRCGGVVAVKRARTGRVDGAMAVPMNCSVPGASTAGAARTP